MIIIKNTFQEFDKIYNECKSNTGDISPNAVQMLNCIFLLDQYVSQIKYEHNMQPWKHKGDVLGYGSKLLDMIGKAKEIYGDKYDEAYKPYKEMTTYYR